MRRRRRREKKLVKIAHFLKICSQKCNKKSIIRYIRLFSVSPPPQWPSPPPRSPPPFRWWLGDSSPKNRGFWGIFPHLMCVPEGRDERVGRPSDTLQSTPPQAEILQSKPPPQAKKKIPFYLVLKGSKIFFGAFGAEKHL